MLEANFEHHETSILERVQLYYEIFFWTVLLLLLAVENTSKYSALSSHSHYKIYHKIRWDEEKQQFIFRNSSTCWEKVEADGKVFLFLFFFFLSTHLRPPLLFFRKFLSCSSEKSFLLLLPHPRIFNLNGIWFSQIIFFSFLLFNFQDFATKLPFFLTAGWF